jgi:antitoxin component YwqK of YwqJK toxin-antitoxin module
MPFSEQNAPPMRSQLEQTMHAKGLDMSRFLTLLLFCGLLAETMAQPASGDSSLSGRSDRQTPAQGNPPQVKVEPVGKAWLATIRDQTGAMRIQRYYLDRQLKTAHGTSRTYDPLGRLSSTGTYRMGQAEDWWVSYHPNGMVRDSAFYRMGKRDGPFRQYHPNGRLQARGKYDQNLAEGIWQGFYADGEPASIADFERGQLADVSYFTRTGEVLRNEPSPLFRKTPRIIYFDAILEPESDLRYASYYGTHRKLPSGLLEVTMYDLTGQKASTVHFTSQSFRNRSGPFLKYDENGRVRISAYFKDNLLSGSFHRWHASGQLSDTGRLVKGDREGIWESWYENGARKDSGEYRMGMRTGLWSEWDKERNEKAIGLYRRGIRDGEWKHYDRNGRILYVNRYRYAGARMADRIDVGGR